MSKGKYFNYISNVKKSIDILFEYIYENGLRNIIYEYLV